MQDRKYPVPRRFKDRGPQMTNVSYKMEPELAQAIKEFAARQSKIQGVKVSPVSVIRRDVLATNPWVRQRYKHLTKQSGRERKYA